MAENRSRNGFTAIEWIARERVAIARSFDSASSLLQVLEDEGHVIVSAVRAGGNLWVFRLVDRDQQSIELYVILDMEVLRYEVAYWDRRRANWRRYDMNGQYAWSTEEETRRVAEKLRRHFSGQIKVWPSLYRPF